MPAYRRQVCALRRNSYYCCVLYKDFGSLVRNTIRRDDVVNVQAFAFPSIGPWLTIVGFIWALSLAVEGIASPSAKANVSKWLKHTEIAETFANWAGTFSSLFDSIFGKRHWAWRCFEASCVASVFSVVTLMILWATVRPQQIWSYLDDPHFWAHNFGVLFATLWLNFLPDYLSLLETRYAIGLMQRAHSWVRIVLILIADLIATILIAFSAFLAYLGFWYVIAGREPDFLRWLVYDFVSNGIFLDATNYRGVPFGVWFYSTFFTSVWVWLYGLSGLTYRLVRSHHFTSLIGILKWFLDVDNKPIWSIGVVLLLLLGLIYAIWVLFRFVLLFVG